MHARGQAAGRKFMRLMTAHSEDAQRAGSGFHMNPSPGNIKDGLITDAIQIAGAARKGGTSPVRTCWTTPNRPGGTA